MMWLCAVVAGVALAMGVVPLLMTWRFRRHVDRYWGQPPGLYAPRATMIVPCKGFDLGFERNIRAMLRQDYPSYELLFVTESAADPAYPVLSRLIQQDGRGHARLVVAGIGHGRAQKITNMLAGLQAADPASRAFAFIDADMRLHPLFLRYLIAPLGDPSIGATTGFPFFLPQRGRAGSVLRSIWGGGGLLMMADPKRNFAHAAATAVRRDLIERADLPRSMRHVVSDTFTTTGAARSLGLSIHWVPQCLAASPDDSSVLETLRWTNRQTVISRVYSPGFWRTVAVTYSVTNLLLLGGVTALAWAAATGAPGAALLGVAALSMLPLQICNTALTLSTIQRLLPRHAAAIGRLSWLYCLLGPLGWVLIGLNSACSMTTNEIEWRGIRYRLVSPRQTVVLSEPTRLAEAA